MMQSKHAGATRHWVLAWAISTLVLGLVAEVRAEAISYSLTLCEDLDVLRDPMNKTLAMNAAWKPQHTLMLERTYPYLELRNTSETASITQFSMSIGDLSKNYDWATMIEASPGVTFSLITPDNLAGGARSDTLLIDLSGLDPGEFVRFRVGLSDDNPAASAIQDFRQILFDLNGNDASNNAVVTVDFESSLGQKSLEQQLPNFTTGGMNTAMDMSFPHQYHMDMIMPFTITDQGTIPDEPGGGTQVPEPGSVVLLATGLLGLAWLRSARRRRQQR